MVYKMLTRAELQALHPESRINDILSYYDIRLYKWWTGRVIPVVPNDQDIGGSHVWSKHIDTHFRHSILRRYLTREEMIKPLTTRLVIENYEYDKKLDMFLDLYFINRNWPTAHIRKLGYVTSDLV